jgi:3-deoxy-D-manno-octulosonate 8-phosphate phosphatase (KDO 8-P phosphatase)
MKDIKVCLHYFKRKLFPLWKAKDNIQVIQATDIDLIVYDFDGVMTDNRVIVLGDGTEGVMANRADGLGVDRFRTLGIPQFILSTETNPVVKARGAKLGLEVIASCKDKELALRSYCEQNGYDLQRVVYIGNDLNDLEVMKIIGFPVAPADAHPEVRAVAKVVTMSKGGEGVVKELADHIIKY